MDTSLPSLWWALWSPNGAVLTMNTLLSSCWWTLCQPNSAVLTMDTLLPSHQWTLWSPNGSTWSAASPTFLSILQSGRDKESNIENKALEMPRLEESYLEWHVQYAEHILWHSDTRNTRVSHNIVTPKTQECLHVVADTQDTGLSPQRGWHWKHRCPHGIVTLKIEVSPWHRWHWKHRDSSPWSDGILVTSGTRDTGFCVALHGWPSYSAWLALWFLQQVSPSLPLRVNLVYQLAWIWNQLRNLCLWGISRKS